MHKTAKRVKIILLFIVLFLFLGTGCTASSEDLSTFRRKVGRVDLIYQSIDQYDMDTTITQLISMESRTKIYNFAEGTRIAYQTSFITIPTTVIYSFGDGGALSKMEYIFELTPENAEDEIAGIYEECSKFFDYPDEGYLRDIYSEIDESPTILWVKNNATIQLDFWMDEDLVPHATLDYQRAEWSGTSVAVFKLPFSPHALGDSISSVVSAETKKNSTKTNSMVRYTYTVNDNDLLTVDYIFMGETLESVDMVYRSQVSSGSQMRNLTGNFVEFMKTEFDGAYIIDNTDNEKYDIQFIGEAADISMISRKDSGSRDISIHVGLYPYVS